MHAAQITLISLWGVNFGLVWAKHGQPRTDKHDAWVQLTALAVVAAILWWGGFWG